MRFKVVSILLLLPVLCWAQSEPPKKAEEASEDHQASIHGIRIGMTTPQVLERLGGRMPDQRKDEKDEIIVFWKLEGGDVLQVNFRKENYVSHIALQFNPPRPTNDFWLRKLSESSYGAMTSEKPIPSSGAADSAQPVPGLGRPPGEREMEVTQTPVGKAPPRLSSSRGTGELTARDPRWRVDYKVSETEDRERTVWVREQDGEGFRIEIRFLSAHKKRLGDRYESEVEFKYVSVNRNDLKKFDQAMTGKK
jgi:hypothetical protein